MSIPSKFEGHVYFYWWPQHKVLLISDTERDNPDYIFLGASQELSISFDIAAVTESAIVALKKSIETERAESQKRISLIQGRIQSLRALEHVA